MLCVRVIVGREIVHVQKLAQPRSTGSVELCLIIGLAALFKQYWRMRLGCAGE
jgi:hypothetical protein